MLMRAITGAFVGVVGSFMTFMASLMLALSFCGWDETCTDDARRSSYVAGSVGLLGGLVVMALVYVGLLKLQRRPRPWSVAVPAMVLSAVPFAIFPEIWQLSGMFYVPAVAFAVAGVITGFGSWREILRGGAR
jgi:uncharacterized membrane protein